MTDDYIRTLVHHSSSCEVHGREVRQPGAKLLRIRDNVEAIERLMSNLRIEGEAAEETQGILKYTFKVYC